MSKNEFEPDWVSPPGDTISEMLSQNRLSLDEFAEEMSLSLQEAEGLVKGREEITVDLANKLGVLFGAPARFWLRREAHYVAGLRRLGRSRPD